MLMELVSIISLPTMQSPVQRSCWMNRDEAMIVASSLSFDESNSPRVVTM